MKVSATQHQEGESGDEIEVEEVGVLAEPTDERAEPSDDESEGNWEIEVQRAQSESVPSAHEKVGAANEKSERGRDERNEVKKWGERKIWFHTDVTRQGKGHGVERKPTANGEPSGQAGRTDAGVGRTEEVAELLDLCGEVAEPEGVDFPIKSGLASLRVDVNARGSRILEVNFFDEPNAAEAGDAVELEGEGI